MKSRLLKILFLLALMPTALAAGLPGDSGFISNGGQWDSRVLFSAKVAQARVWVLEDGFVVDRRDPCSGERSVFRVRFDGEGGPRSSRGELPRSSKHSAHLGRRSGTDCRAYGQVVLSGLGAGVDVRLRTADGHLEYDLLVEPGAEPESILVVLDGARLESLSADGSLRLRDPRGEVLLQSAPRSFVSEGETWMATPSEVCVVSETSFTLVAPERSRASSLIVDPGLEWSTFLGSADEDRGVDVAVASDGDVIVAGDTSSFDFPTTTGVFQPGESGGGDLFVSRLSSDGSTLRWSTFLGGSGSDSVSDVHLDANGDVVLCGTTFSSDFPRTAGAYRTSLQGVASGFVSRIDGATGQSLLASTFVGGTGFDVALGSAITPSTSAAFPDSIVVVGSTTGGFPVTSQVWQSNFAGGPSFAGDGFVTRLTPSLGNAHFSTYLGASGGADSCLDVAIRPDGEVVVVGTTDSPNFPAAGGAQSTSNGGADGFLFELSPDGSQRIASSLHGGSEEESLVRVALTTGGEIVAAGDTRSDDVPLGSSGTAFQSLRAGERDGIVGRWSSDLSTLRWSTYLGGLQDDEVRGLVLAANDDPIVVGATKSRQFPSTVWSLDPYFSGPFPVNGFEGDAFATRLSGDGSQMEYGTFIGASLDEQANGIALTASGAMVLTGQTKSFQFPSTPGAFDTVADFTGLNDAWTMQLDFTRFPFVVGTPKLTSIGNQPLIYPSGFPSVSGGSFGVSIDGAEPNSGFTLLLGSTNLVDRPFFGGNRYVGHPIQRIGSSPLGFFGSAAFSVPGDVSMIGQTWRYQFWFQDPNDAFGVGLSDAVEVTYVP